MVEQYRAVLVMSTARFVTGYLSTSKLSKLAPKWSYVDTNL